MLYATNHAVYSKEKIMYNGPKLVTESSNRNEKGLFILEVICGASGDWYKFLVIKH